MIFLIDLICIYASKTLRKNYIPSCKIREAITQVQYS